LTYGNFKFVDESGNKLDIEYPKLDFGEEEEVDVHDDGYDGDVNSIKYIYQDSTWHQNFINYDLEPEEFFICSRSNFHGNQLPSFF